MFADMSFLGIGILLSIFGAGCFAVGKWANPDPFIRWFGLLWIIASAAFFIGAWAEKSDQWIPDTFTDRMVLPEHPQTLSDGLTNQFALEYSFRVQSVEPAAPEIPLVEHTSAGFDTEPLTAPTMEDATRQDPEPKKWITVQHRSGPKTIHISDKQNTIKFVGVLDPTPPLRDRGSRIVMCGTSCRA